MMINQKKVMAAIALSLIALGCKASPYGIIHQNYTLDVYQSKQINPKVIDDAYHSELTKIASILLNSKTMPSEKNNMGLDVLFTTVLEGINKKGNFAYLGLSPVTYPGGDKIGFTVDAVDAADKWRTEGFHPTPTATIPDPAGLIAAWLQYEKTGFDYLFRTKKSQPYKHCPAFHCLFGFEEPELKQYAKKFNAEVPRHKKELIHILREDKDEIKRGAAAYLLAHLSDGKDLVKTLSPSMRDNSSHVRNNVMRVLAQTAKRVPNADFPLDDTIRALTYPTDPDRNKALYMLEMMTPNPHIAKYVREHGCHEVMDQYRTVQLNLHHEAYNVLVNISHKNFALSDYAAWEHWASEHC